MVMIMNLRKNLGIIMMMLGVLLTINQGEQQKDLIKQIEVMVKTYWPLILSIIGIYMISTPVKRRK